MQTLLTGGGHRLDLSRPQVMGILNVTPDSFSDGGQLRTDHDSGVFCVSVDKALQRAERSAKTGDKDAKARVEVLARPVMQRWPRLRDHFLKILTKARYFPAIREDTRFYGTMLVPSLRAALLEAGRRLTEVGALDAVEDVFHLKLAELEAIAPRLRQEFAAVQRFDLVVLNAGVLAKIRDMVETPIDVMQHAMKVNTWANKAILDALFMNDIAVEQVVGLSSGAAISGHRGWNAYGVSKAAVINLTTQLAVELGAASVDHCTFLTDADVEALAGSDTVATLLPGVEFSTRQPYPDARRLLDAGAQVAIASDCNPGTCYSSSMPLMIALAVREMGMTPAEALRAATVGGARALRRDDIGRIAVGLRADFALVDAPSWLHIPYRVGVPIVRALEV